MVETLFQYRTLIGKCELGCGLDWDEIDQLAAVEQAFVADRRDKAHLRAVVRGDRINDRVQITEVGPDGLVCRGAPFIASGEMVEVVIDIADRSYRFRAIGKWLKDDGDDFQVGLAFIGVPICLNLVQVSAHEHDLVDEINAAA